MAGALRAPLRRRAGGLALRSRPRAPAASPGARSPRARRRSWSAPARRCSCRSPISAWSSSTRSTRPRSSRRTAWSTTRATWRWCARGCARRPAVLVSATPSLETLANVEAGRYRAPHPADAPRRRDAAARSPPIDLRADAAGARPIPGAAADRGGARDAGARRAGDAVPQPPRLRAADAVPRTAATACSARTAPPGWSSTARGGCCNATIAATPIPIPPDCPACGAGAQPDAGRPGRGAHHRGGRGAVPRRAPPGDGERHAARPACRRRGRPRHRERARST